MNPNNQINMSYRFKYIALGIVVYVVAINA